MSIENMVRTSKNDINANTGAVYHSTVSITSGVYSNTYLLPTQHIYAIAARIDGDGITEFTNDTEEAIIADTADWAEWDGVSEINKAVTAFRVKWTSGTVIFKLTVKTADM